MRPISQNDTTNDKRASQRPASHLVKTQKDAVAAYLPLETVKAIHTNALRLFCRTAPMRLFKSANDAFARIGLQSAVKNGQLVRIGVRQDFLYFSYRLHVITIPHS